MAAAAAAAAVSGSGSAAAAAKQGAASTLSSAHGADERRVEDYERRARNEVDEDDAEPVVDVEVDVLVTGDERREVVQTRRHRRRRSGAIVAAAVFAVVAAVAGREKGLDDDRRVHVLREAEHLRREGGHVDASDRLQDVRHRAPALPRCRMADVDVTVDGERHRQPDGRCVENRRQVIGEAE